MTIVLNGTTGITNVNGTAAAPAETGTDTDSGIVYGTNTVSLATNGTTALTVDASQNVGIGTASPSTTLQVNKTLTNGGGLQGVTRLVGDLSGGLSLQDGGSIDFYRATSQIAARVGFVHDIAGAENYAMVFYTTASSTAAERMRITSNGNLLVGTTNTSATAGVGLKFIISTDVSNPVIKSVMTDSSGAYSTYNLYCTNASAYRFYVTTAGVVNATTTTITAISDQRLKENIRDLDDGLEKVLALKPRKFDWKENKGENIKNARGFIAQELELVFPDMISNWIDEPPEGEEPYKAVNANLIPSLVKAIQEQQALITVLTARITALEVTNG
jgi:hypothetical protein